MGCIILILAVLVKLSPLPEIELDEDGNVEHMGIFEQITNVFKFPQLVLGVITLMLYLSAEVLAGDSIGGFGKQLGVYGQDGNFYLKLTSFTMTSMVVSYLLGIALIPKYISQMLALKASGILGLILVLLIVSISPNISIQLPGIPALPLVIILVACMGLSNALCWPAIWPLALQNLGGYTKIASAVLIIGIIGGAIFPLIYASLVETINLANEASGINKTAKIGNQLAYLILLPTYLMIIFYAFKGHKPKLRNRNSQIKFH